MALLLVMAISGCSQQQEGGNDEPQGNDTFTVGIVQLVQHPALDAATKGFEDALKEGLGESVTIVEENASGDSATCSTIVQGFVNDNVDLIMANATPALQAAVSATGDIPILGTSVTEYGVALGIENFNGTVGANVSGTSDLAPLDQQAQMILDLFPETKTVGIIYCSNEANSKYQVEKVSEYLEGKSIEVKTASFTDSNDIALVTGNLCDEVDVIYIPTDNQAASCAETIANVVTEKKVPVITGEEGICKGCGVATLSISYYDLGVETGKMAVKILKGEAKIEEMPIQYYPDPIKKYNPEFAAMFEVEIPDTYEVIE